ncbi:MAG: hypothetical protein MHM6MM_004295, partial [Cercozoa sp. M6MM]
MHDADLVWVPLQSTRALACARVLERHSDGTVSVRVMPLREEDGTPGAARTSVCDTVQRLSKDVLEAAALPEVIPSDFSLLRDFGAGAVLRALRKRYSEDKIYSRVGPTLLATNPYRVIPALCAVDLIAKYAHAAQGADGDIWKLPPHIYSIAAAALRGASGWGEPAHDQSVIISGESGAGKTESTKSLLHFLSETCGGGGVGERLVATSPVLEAFGNAKTTRNDNSSRFGKWLALDLTGTGSTKSISGARIIQYLLEKSRVVRHAVGERNFHILHQLCAGLRRCAPALAKELHLHHSNFAFLLATTDKGIAAEKVDLEREDADAAEFATVRAAVAKLCQQSECKSSDSEIWRVLAAVLHLGELEFEGEESASVSNEETLRRTASVLRVPRDVLYSALCEKSVVVCGDTIR